jgi:hypothetical protein
MINLSKKEFLIVSVLYTTSFALMLINQGIYWDDWTLYNQAPSNLLIQFQENGNILIGYLHIFLMSLPEAVIVYHTIIFLTYLLSAFFLLQTLKKTQYFDTTARLLIVIIFAIFPINEARITLICSPYAFTYLLFFCGLWLTTRYHVNQRYSNRILALICFFTSFMIPSFIVFYVLIILLIALKEDILKKITLIKIKKFTLKHLDFILLPIIFGIIRYQFLMPKGIYELTNYNQITLFSIIKSPVNTIFAINESIIETIFTSLQSLTNFTTYSIIAISILYLAIKRKNHNIQPTRNNQLYLLIGIIIFYISIFAYIAVGRNGLSYGNGWGSRDELLIPLSAAIIIYYGLMLIFKEFNFTQKNTHLVFTILIISFTCLNINNQINMIEDNLKQQAIIDEFKENKIIKEHTTFIIEDRCRELNLFNRTYGFYEYNGMLRQAQGNDQRLAINEEDFQINFQNDINNSMLPLYITRAYYNMSDYKIHQPEYKIIIKKGKNQISKSKSIKLAVKQLLKKDISEEIKDIVNFEYIQLNN